MLQQKQLNMTCCVSAAENSEKSTERHSTQESILTVCKCPTLFSRNNLFSLKIETFFLYVFNYFLLL